jgi:hypothetical protein
VKHADTQTHVWRSTSERGELVERIIELTAENRRLRMALREAAGDESNLVLTLCARIEGLEQNIDRLTRKKGRAA